MTQQPEYSGGRDAKGLPKWQPKIGEKLGERRFDPYFPSEDLIEAVNLAIKLKRPLLLEGEPGCGKTRLADAIAYEFTQKYLAGKQPWPYHIWNVKSIGRARDGLYTFDAVLRLRDAQLMGSNFERLEKHLGETESDLIKKRLSDKTKYRTLQPFGKALWEDEQYRSILLIDEIDKADSDFPNDLLSVLDRMGFEIPETNDPFKGAQAEPIIIITSNRERPLPEAFLRRCLYFYVKFPDDELLQTIIERRFENRLSGKDDLKTKALDKIQYIRGLLNGKPGSKLPGTSEIIELLDVLIDLPQKSSLEIIENLAQKFPYLGILLKTQVDQTLYRKDQGIQDNE